MAANDRGQQPHRGSQPVDEQRRRDSAQQGGDKARTDQQRSGTGNIPGDRDKSADAGHKGGGDHGHHSHATEKGRGGQHGASGNFSNAGERGSEAARKGS